MAAIPVSEQEIRTLVDAIDRADQVGDAAGAERALARVRELAPDHAGVLNLAGMRALRKGDVRAALPLLERATEREPNNPMLWINLAFARRDSGDRAGELAAVERALVADPRFYPALLHKARLFELDGNVRQAASMYYAFLCCVPPGEQAPAVVSAIQHAQEVMRKNDRALEAFLEPRLAELRSRHAGDKLERFEACFETVVGKRATYTQQPTSLFFPRLPPIEFVDREYYPWLDAFDSATDAIRAEALAALSQAAGDFVPYISKPAGMPVDQWGELNNSKRWSTLFLIKNGRRMENALARAPRTAALLDAAPLCQIPGHAPTAFFSVLAPRTRIPPHTGVTNARYIVHLPLVVPPGCMYRVGAERRPWKEGRAWVFDDTFEHEAINDSDAPRVVLIFDVWNCYLTLPERELVASLIAGVQEYNEGGTLFRQGG
jgi:tetratricopeptide (TPR) repeat protein